MKNTTLIILLLISLSHFAMSQDDTVALNNKVDTLETHYHSITWQSSNGKLTYYENGKKISKAKFETLKNEIIDPNLCTPCYLIAYQDDKIIYEGDFYTDCGIGLYIDYYSNGTIKSKGEYKRNANQNWDITKTSEWCAIKNGRWENFDDKGNIIKSEQYENGILIK